MTEEKMIWNKQALVEYVTRIIHDEFDDEIECRVSYKHNELMIE